MPATGVTPTVASVGGSSYVDWPAIFAGAVVATAIAFVLGTFGAALGLSLVAPFEEGGIGAIGFLIAVGIWTVWVAASSFMAGGYLTGRLRRRIPDATEDEVATRDGAHGLVVWGVGALLGALLLAFTTVTTAQTAAIAGAQAAGATVEAGSDALATADIEGLADSLMRSDRTGADTTSASQEASRLLAGDEDMSDGDRQYLVSLVTRTTGLDAEQAEARVSARRFSSFKT